jgi:hypothetical protein
VSARIPVRAGGELDAAACTEARASGPVSMPTPAAGTMPGTAPAPTAVVNNDVARELEMASRAYRRRVHVALAGQERAERR